MDIDPASVLAAILWRHAVLSMFDGGWVHQLIRVAVFGPYATIMVPDARSHDVNGRQAVLGGRGRALFRARPRPVDRH